MAETVGMSLTIPFVFPVPAAPATPPGGGGSAPASGEVGMTPPPSAPAPAAAAPAEAAPPAFTPSAFFQAASTDVAPPAYSGPTGAAAQPAAQVLYEDIFRSFDDDKDGWLLT